MKAYKSAAISAGKMVQLSAGLIPDGAFIDPEDGNYFIDPENGDVIVDPDPQ